MKNEHAQNLGRLCRGKRKTMSKAAIKQRRKAARKSARKRRGKPRNQPRDRKPPVPAEVAPVEPVAAPTETLSQEPCQPRENAEQKEKDTSLTESLPSDTLSFDERKHLLA
jgi:hypothetical protein